MSNKYYDDSDMDSDIDGDIDDVIGDIDGIIGNDEDVPENNSDIDDDVSEISDMDETDTDILTDAEYDEEELDDAYIFIPNNIKFDRSIHKIVKNEDRITSEKLTKYELAEITGIRAEHISRNNITFYKSDVELTNPINMARQELNENRTPMRILRHVGQNYYEIWDPNKMVKEILPYI